MARKMRIALWRALSLSALALLAFSCGDDEGNGLSGLASGLDQTTITNEDPYASEQAQENAYNSGGSDNNPYASEQAQDNPYNAEQAENNPYGQGDSESSAESDSKSSDWQDLMDDLANAQDLQDLEDILNEYLDLFDYDVVDCAVSGGVPCLDECCENDCDTYGYCS